MKGMFSNCNIQTMNVLPGHSETDKDTRPYIPKIKVTNHQPRHPPKRSTFTFAARKLNHELKRSLAPKFQNMFKTRHFQATSAAMQLANEKEFAKAFFQASKQPFTGCYLFL
jgi:hypothetical protein